MPKRHVHPASNLQPLSYVPPKTIFNPLFSQHARPILTLAFGCRHDGGRDSLRRRPYNSSARGLVKVCAKHDCSNAASALKFLECVIYFLDFPPTVSKPIRRPNSVHVPTEIFENHRSQTVTISHRFRRVIACPVAFHAKNKSARLFGMPDGDINEEPRHADSRYALQTASR